MMPDLSPYTFKDNTFTAMEQSFAAVEVGDAKQSDAFYPQVKIMRWDNEVNFSVRLVTDAPPVAVGTPDDVTAIQAATAQKIASLATANIKIGGSTLQPVEPEPVDDTPAVALVDDKVQWVTPAVEAHFYQVGDGLEGDSFEAEIILNEQPPTPRITFTLQSKGLNFFPQPALTDEEIALGCERPENIIDSLAIYHSTMVGDYTALGGLNYMVGKFGHIMRPQMVDVNGWTVWGTPSVDVEGGFLYVDMPKDFWRDAAYPVRHAAGLEFGYHAVGGTEDANIGFYNILTKSIAGGTSPGLPAGNGTLTAINVYGKWRAGGVAPCQNPALYSNSGTAPSARLAYLNSGGTVFLSNINSWVRTLLTYPIILNTQYWLGTKNNDGLVYDTLYYDSGGSTYYKRNESWPATISGYSSFGRTYSIYAEYVQAGGLLLNPGTDGGFGRFAMTGGFQA